jgi:hypothetical protein
MMDDKETATREWKRNAMPLFQQKKSQMDFSEDEP